MRRRLLAISIRWQLVVLVLVTMLPLLVGLLTVYLDATSNHYQTVINNTKSVSQTFELEQQTLLDNAYTLLSTLADVAAHEDQAKLKAILQKVQSRSPEYLNLFYVGQDGYMSVSVLPSNRTFLGDRQYVKDATSYRKFSVGSFQMGRVTGKPSINCGYPVIDSSGRVIGVMGVSIKLTKLADMERRLNLPAGAELVMSDRGGAVLASTVRNAKPGSPEPPFIKQLLSKSHMQSKVITEKTNKGPVYHYMTALRTRQNSRPYGYFRVTIAKAMMLETAHRRSIMLLVMLIPFMLLPLILSYVIGRRYISKRLDSVVEAAQQLQTGDLTARSALTDGLGEIGLLSNVFNDMASAIQKGYQQHQWAEKQMRESEARYRGLVEQLPAATYVLALSGREIEVMFLNAHITEISGYQASEHISNPYLWSNLVHPDDQEAYGRYMHEVGHGQTMEQTYRILDKSKSVRWIFEKSQRIDSPESEYDVIQGLILDITEMHMMAEELRTSDERFKLLVQSMRELVITLDIERRVSGVYGSSADVPIGIVPRVGQRLADLLPEPTAGLHQHYLILAEQGLPQSFEWSINQHDCEWYLLTSLSAVMHEEKGFQGFVIVVKDITEIKMAEIERRQLDNKIQQAQRLESLGLMAGGIAHDFNNLLTGVMGHTSLAMENVPQSSLLYRELVHIETATQYASELVKQMLAYSGHSTIQKSVLKLSSTIEDMTQLLMVSIPKDITITMNLDPDVLEIEADLVQIQQVLMNLIINAGEAMGDSTGHITIETFSRRFEEDELAQGYMNDELHAGDYTVLQITDTGCGMDTNTAEKLFDPFFTTKFTGRGLGMAAVLGILLSHSGGIKVNSSLGEGSCFTLIFPAMQRQAAVRTKTDTQNWIPIQGLCALVVDDEEGVRVVASAILQRFGLTVEHAVDGLQGVEMVTANPDKYDLILMDLTMPRMGGEEALAKIKQVRPNLPVIISSGFTQTDIQLPLSHNRFDAFLQKPYRMEQVKQVVAQVLGIHPTK